MVSVLASLLFALPTSVLVCLTRGLDVLEGGSLVLMALVSIPAVVTSALLLVQALSAPQRYVSRAAGNLISSGIETAQDWVDRGQRMFDRVES